jgi:hypothetical protein
MYFRECGACSSGFTGCGNSGLFCYSGRSGESLFDLTHEKKERFLALLGMTKRVGPFFRSLFSLWGLISRKQNPQA